MTRHVFQIPSEKETTLKGKVLLQGEENVSFKNSPFLEVLQNLTYRIRTITAFTPISAQSSNLAVFKLQPVYIYLYIFIKAYIVATHLNYLDKSRHFKGAPATYAFVKDIRKYQVSSNASLLKPFADLTLKVCP